MIMDMTASQTVGPYLHIGLANLYTDNLRADGVDGEPIVIEGRVLDGGGEPVPDGMVEIWQANSHGKYADPQDARALPLEAGFPRIRAGGNRRAGAIPVRDRQAWPRAGAGRQLASAAYRRFGV